MDKRYLVEELKPYSPDDAEWEPQESFDDVNDAQANAQSRIQPTQHGDSGVRVFDTVAQKIVWTNC